MKNKDIKIVVIIIVLLLLLIGAGVFFIGVNVFKIGDKFLGFISEENQLVDEKEAAFLAQAKKQYGDAVTVDCVTAEKSVQYVSSSTGHAMRTTGNLLGRVCTYSGDFYAIYYTNLNVIHSQANFYSIEESLVDELKNTNISVDAVSIKNNKFDKLYLPDNVKTFDDLVKGNYDSYVTIFTVSDINDEKIDLAGLKELFTNNCTDDSSLLVVQLKDFSKKKDLIEDLEDIDFDEEDCDRDIYDYDQDKYVDAFDKYTIKKAVYIDKNSFVVNQ